MAARTLSVQGRFTVEDWLGSLDSVHRYSKANPILALKKQSRKAVRNQVEDAYHTAPVHRHWMRSTSIRLEPKRVAIPINLKCPLSPEPSGPPECFVAIVVHLSEDFNPTEIGKFRQMIESLPVKWGFTAKVLFQLELESTLAMVAIPSTLWGYLKFHAAFMLIGRIRDDKPLAALRTR